MTTPPPDTDWLARSAVADPMATALIEDDGTALSYRELSDLADEHAAALADAGVLPGALQLVPVGEIDSSLVARLWGMWRSRISPLVVDVDSPLLTKWRSGLPESWSSHNVTNATIHTAVLTSGSGGKPLPVRLTPGNVASAVAGSQRRLGNTAADRWLLVLPLFHIGGLSVLWRTAAAGGTVVVHRKFDAVRAAAAINSGAVTMASFVPTMLYRMLEAAPGPYAGMRGLLLGGAAASRELIERGIDAGLPILQTYGMTEACSQICTVVPGGAVESLGTAGPPIDTVDVTTGGVGFGEIVISGPAVSPGYLGEPDRVGGHRTGDIGYLDDKGRLVVVGRADDMVITGGENVYPERVADLLNRHESIRQVQVVGVPDPEWGQALVAVAVGDADDRDGIEEWAQKHLPRHEIPKRWVFVDALPTQPGGKVDRMAIHDIAGVAD